jgi:uncharacterized protein (TIGR03435 family)
MAISVLALTRALTSMSGRLVLDETNLTGDFDIVLDYWVEAGSGRIAKKLMRPFGGST